MPSTIFAGSKVKTLKDTLTLNGKSDIISSTVDPTVSAVDAPIGSLLINQTSGKLYRKLDSGSSVNWEEVGSGTGGINYILNPSAEVNTTGWSTYADAAGTAPVDGSGGSPNVTWTRSTSSPLRGVADFNFAKDAANRQGQGVSVDFTIDEADKAKVLSVTFDYEVLSGTYADADLTVYLIADPTGTPVVIQPAGYTVQAATVGTTMRQIATFQTQATGLSYRLCFHVASTSASAYTLAVDNVVVGPQSTVQGAAISDWVSYTPTVTPGSGTITNSNPTAKYRRVGDSMEISGIITFSAASAAFSNVIVSIPTGFSIDSTKTSSSRVGSGTIVDAGVTYYPLEAILQSNTSVILYVGNSAGSFVADALISNTQPFTLGASDAIAFIFTVPIQGWSSNTVLSQDTDTRVVAFTGSFITTSIPTGTLDTAKIIAPSSSQDTHGAYATGLGTYTVPVSGFYKITHQNSLSLEVSKIFRVGYTINSTTAFTKAAIITNTSAAFSISAVNTCSGIEKLNAGDIIRFAVSHNNAGATSLTNDGRFQVYTIERLSGPATIAASEKLACSYNTSTSVITGSGTWSQVTYTNKVVDTHDIYNTSTGVATIPVSGIYRITHQMRSKNALIAGQYLSIHFVKNGTSFSELLTFAVRAGAAGMVSDTSGPATWVGTLLAGDLIRFSMDSNSAANGPTTAAVEQVGNTFTIQLI